MSATESILGGPSLGCSSAREREDPGPQYLSDGYTHDDIVIFKGQSDPDHPQNWALTMKVYHSAILALSTFTVGFNSALFSAGAGQFATEFKVSHEVGTLGVSLYVIGFATGPVFWAPYSEIRGRRTPILIGLLGFAVFCLGVGAGKDVQTVLICRFWSGIFGASPMTIVAAVFADMFDSSTRGLATTIFSMNMLMGPMLAPSIGGFICNSHLGWRWTAWLGSIMGLLSLLLSFFFLEETYAPTILQRKAAYLRRRTKNWALHAEQDEIEIGPQELLTKYLSRPLQLLFTEPLVFLVSIYLAFIYGLVYLFLTAYPLVFEGVHHMKPGVAGLTYIAMIAGIFLGGLYLVVSHQPTFHRKLITNNNDLIPEWRLPPAILGSISFAGGLFWFGWTGYQANVHWIVPTMSGLLTGFGILTIFQQLLNYLVDIYLPYAASVNAGSSIIRSLCGAGFPLFAKAMFVSLGINWASTILGGFAVLCILMPVAFYFWGPRIRSRSKFSVIQGI